MLLVVEAEKGVKASPYIFEIGQYWWNYKGKQAVIAIQRTLGYYIDSFAFCSPLALRKDNEAYRHVAHAMIYPKFKATDTLRRNGFANDLHNIAPTTLIPALLTDSRAETLMKARRVEHLHHFLSSKHDLDNCWNSYKCAIRHEYEISDIYCYDRYLLIVCQYL